MYRLHLRYDMLGEALYFFPFHCYPCQAFIFTFVLEHNITSSFCEIKKYVNNPLHLHRTIISFTIPSLGLSLAPSATNSKICVIIHVMAIHLHRLPSFSPYRRLTQKVPTSHLSQLIFQTASSLITAPPSFPFIQSQSIAFVPPATSSK